MLTIEDTLSVVSRLLRLRTGAMDIGGGVEEEEEGGREGGGRHEWTHLLPASQLP
jgi:hypothetical protein